MRTLALSVVSILALVSVCSNTTFGVFKNFNILDSLSVFVYVGGDV